MIQIWQLAKVAFVHCMYWEAMFGHILEKSVHHFLEWIVMPSFQKYFVPTISVI